MPEENNKPTRISATLTEDKTAEIMGTLETIEKLETRLLPYWYSRDIELYDHLVDLRNDLLLKLKQLMHLKHDIKCWEEE